MGEEHDHHRHDHDEHDHDDHDHTEPPAEVALRVKALETLLTARGYVSTEALDAVVDMFETKVGPRNGARVVARAWTDPAYRQRLLDSPTAAIAEFGFINRQGEHMQVVEIGRAHV